MPRPFDAITIDGRLLKGEGILAYARDLHVRTGADWTRSILELFEELVSSERPLGARTSGTTGTPKVMDIPRRDLVASAELTAATFGLKKNDRALLCLPCEFIAGKMMVVRAMVLGLDLHIMDPQGSVLEKLNLTDRFRFAAMVPQQLHRALREDRPQVERQFDTILLGGGPVSHELIAELSGLRTNVFQSYGSTETVTHIAFRKLNPGKRPALSGVEGSVIDGDTQGPGPSTALRRGLDAFTAIGDVSFATDERGCLIINTPHLSTRQHITNDIVELIDVTRFRWLGRFDNVILSGGKKIFPEQLESKTASVLPHPHYFTAVPDAMLGQAIALVIESDGNEEMVMTEAMNALRPVLEKHELPRIVRIMPSFARTISGKIVRSA